MAIASILASAAPQAQEPDDGQGARTGGSSQPIEEVVAVGRFLSAAESLTQERLRVPFSADFLGADAISRAGDGDIASALRRVPGLTLVDGRFVYVRGLGERYSTVLINGGSVTSPELTRSVIPLDIFPTAIVDSIKIQKSPSPEVPASFGGGVIDVRTNSVPMDAVADLELDIGTNSISTEDGLTYPMGSGPFPHRIRDALDTYQGSIGISTIMSSLRRTNPLASQADAEAVHQQFIESLDTDIGIEDRSLDPDLGGKFSLGNAWYFGEDEEWRFGVLVNGSYDEKYRNEDQLRETAGSADTIFENVERTVYEERTLGSLNLGLSFREQHTIELSGYEIGNDESITSVSEGFDQNYQVGDRQRLHWSTRLEERELELTQISGDHSFLDTPRVTGLLENWGLENLEASWFYSESEATTDAPNAAEFQGVDLLNDARGPELLASGNAGRFEFLNLDDAQQSWGGDIDLPLMLENMTLTLSGGWWGSEKARDYREYNVNAAVRTGNFEPGALDGSPGAIISGGYFNVDNYELSMGTGLGTESYVAAQKIDAGYGMIDMEWDRWRLTIGARGETYQQALLPVDLLDYSGASIVTLQEQLLEPDQTYAFQQEDVYPSAALTLDGNGWLGSGDHQLRISYGESVVRPDLREIAPVVYFDPELDVRVQGDPRVTPSPITNFEARSEFSYGSGNNFTVSLFHKDIEAPIEQVQGAITEDAQLLTFRNAESGEVYGLELEGLKSLPAGLFLSGNATVSDSEIDFGPNTSGLSLTNLTRRMTGHSEWVFNATLGWDSQNALHSAYLNYNAFGDRIYYGGANQNEDAFEQPFHSLGIVYRYFPTDNLELEVQLDNILDEKREFEQAGSNGEIARVLYQDVGMSYGVGVRWTF